MHRQLTALEKLRITGTDNPVEQLRRFAALGILAYERNPTGYVVIECVAYNVDAKAHYGARWHQIRDENIEAWPITKTMKSRLPT